MTEKVAELVETPVEPDNPFEGLESESFKDGEPEVEETVQPEPVREVMGEPAPEHEPEPEAEADGPGAHQRVDAAPQGGRAQG